jgi:acid stress-induced BolA-like protein IbaG/YrbA
MTLQEEMAKALRIDLPDAQFQLLDFTGSGDHWELIIASEAFRGRSRIQQHQLTYRPLRGLIDDGTIHALKLTTLLPEQWVGKP